MFRIVLRSPQFFPPFTGPESSASTGFFHPPSATIVYGGRLRIPLARQVQNRLIGTKVVRKNIFQGCRNWIRRRGICPNSEHSTPLSHVQDFSFLHCPSPHGFIPSWSLVVCVHDSR